MFSAILLCFVFCLFELVIVIKSRRTRDEKIFKKKHLPHSINLMTGNAFETWLGTLIEPHESFYLAAGDEIREAILRSLGYPVAKAHQQALKDARDRIALQTYFHTPRRDESRAAGSPGADHPSREPTANRLGRLPDEQVNRLIKEDILSGDAVAYDPARRFIDYLHPRWTGLEQARRLQESFWNLPAKASQRLANFVMSPVNRLRLVNGIEVPVARNAVADLRAAGWLGEQAAGLETRD